MREIRTAITHRIDTRFGGSLRTQVVTRLFLARRARRS
jgi:hypothetical protein